MGGEGERLEWPLASRNVDWVRGVLERGWPEEVGWRLVGGEPPRAFERGRRKCREGEGEDEHEEEGVDDGGEGNGKGKGKEKERERESESEKRHPSRRRPSRAGVFDRCALLSLAYFEGR